MKKIMFCVVLLFATSMTMLSQSTISYGQIGTYCPQTGQTLAGEGATAITFYDGYITHSLYGKLYATQKNYDGSTTYMPNQMAGTSALQLNAVLISSDRQRMEEHLTSSMGPMSINMINSYTSMGEDGGRAYQQWIEIQSTLKRGGSSSSGRDNDKGVCRSCGGTGVSKTPNSGGSLNSWVAHYNSNGSRCPYCGGYTQHFHNRCSSCNVPRR